MFEPKRFLIECFLLQTCFRRGNGVGWVQGLCWSVIATIMAKISHSSIKWLKTTTHFYSHLYQSAGWLWFHWSRLDWAALLQAGAWLVLVPGQFKVSGSGPHCVDLLWSPSGRGSQSLRSEGPPESSQAVFARLGPQGFPEGLGSFSRVSRGHKPIKIKMPEMVPGPHQPSVGQDWGAGRGIEHPVNRDCSFHYLQAKASFWTMEWDGYLAHG